MEENFHPCLEALYVLRLAKPALLFLARIVNLVYYAELFAVHSLGSGVFIGCGSSEKTGGEEHSYYGNNFLSE